MDRQSLIGLNHFQNKNGILVIQSPTPRSANNVVEEILERYCDSKTAVFLCGDSDLKKLYEDITEKENIKTSAVLQIDEQLGEKLHKKSSELMLKNSGLLGYFESMNVRFYPILQDNLSIEKTALQYDEALRFVFKYFPKGVGVMTLRKNGGIAGIATDPKVVGQMLEDQSSLVSFYETEKNGSFITLNFNALSMLDFIIVLVLGQEKREILNSLFKSSYDEEEIKKFPAKFYLKPEIAKKTIIITDQMI